MIPYLEYEGKKYEFIASMQLKLDFEKAVQEYNAENLTKFQEENNLSNEEMQEYRNGLKKIFNYVQAHKTNALEDLEKNVEMQEEILKYGKLVDKLDLSKVYREYCFKCLQERYGIDDELWEKMLNQYYEDYCDSYSEVQIMINKVIEIVFTRGVKAKKKTPMNWMK